MRSLRGRIGWTHTGLAALLLASAIWGPESSDTPANPVIDSVTDNAMSFNAMSFNALMLHANEKLADYSLDDVVEQGSVFEQDLATDPYSREFMKYLVGCSLAEGEDLSWSYNNKTVTWDGELGLCTSWKGAAPDTECQELVSACLLARVNAYGKSVSISLRGRDTNDDALPLGPTEDADFDWQEGGFFGNIFCADCVDPVLEMNVIEGRLQYRLVNLREPRRSIEVTCDSFEGRSEPEVRRLRDQCHRDFLQTTQYVGVIYKAMFACWSPVWADGEAYARWRICAGAASDLDTKQAQKLCAAWPVGACTAPSPVVPCQTANVCALGDTAPELGDGDVDECRGQPLPSAAVPEPGTCPDAPTTTTPTWHYPLTVFLDEPCDIVPEYHACRLNPEIIDPTTGGPRRPVE